MLIRLKSLAPPALQGRTWEKTTRAKVGRLPAAEISVQDSSLSRVHAELAPVDGGWSLRDLGSTNGTYLNGERIGRTAVNLRPRDLVQFGQVMMTVEEIREPPPAEMQSTGLVAAAVSPVSWEDLSALQLPPSADAVAYRELLAQTAQIGRTFNPSDSLEDYLNTVLWKAAEILDARQGCLTVFDERTTVAKAHKAFSLGDCADSQDWDDRGLTEAVMAHGHSLLIRTSADGTRSSSRSLCALLRVGNRRLGTLSLVRWPEQRPFEDWDLYRADILALSLSPSLECVTRFHEEQRQSFLKTLNVLTRLVQMRDDGTASHAQRVTEYALLLAEELGLKETDQQLLRVGTPLHDLGKVGIRDTILRKPGRLTAEEMGQVRAQIACGAALLEQVPFLTELIPIVRNAHERWDGSGYPDGLSGESIPLLARVVAVADAFDAMTTEQPYRPALSLERALQEIERGAGLQFDPACASAFVRLRGRLENMLSQRCGLVPTIGVEEIRRVRQTV